MPVIASHRVGAYSVIMSSFATRYRMSTNLLLDALTSAAYHPEVLAEVEKNYYENRWWPLSVTDMNLRMLVAGWSTRISYSHIRTYAQVVEKVNAIGWQALCAMEDAEVRELVRAIGLPDARLRYLRSLQSFLNDPYTQRELVEGDHNQIISEFAREVDGAGFKIAQCAVLYARGYHCGIFPVDSGMVDMLSPLYPALLPSGARAHDVLRIWLEDLIAALRDDILMLADEVGFNLALPNGCLPTWWAHLLLIYYKRVVWNRRISYGPFVRSKVGSSGVAVHKSLFAEVHSGRKLSIRGVILEGADGVGKSTMASLLEQQGFETIHSAYISGSNCFSRHRAIIEESRRPVTLDRSFLSEGVYGPVFRSKSRLSDGDLQSLGRLAYERGFVLLYLHEPMKVLLSRREEADASVLTAIVREYERVLTLVEPYMPVYRLSSSSLSESGILSLLGGR